LGKPNRASHLLMDRAYEGNETRQLALDPGYTPVVPPLGTRLEPWQYDREMYKLRNEVERLFRRLKGYRRIFSRFEEARRHVPRLHLLRTHCRRAAVVFRVGCKPG
jgi:transposase